MKRILLTAAMLAVLIPVASAHAEPVAEFSFQLTNPTPEGHFTLVFSSRTFDSTGAVPPTPVENYLRLPTGLKLRPQFLTSKLLCNATELRESLPTVPPAAPYLANLNPLIKTLKKSKSASERKALKNVEACQRARVGSGTVQVDARPAISEVIPAEVFLFLGRPTVKGAIASLQIFGVPDQNDPAFANYPIVRNARVVSAANFFNEPTPEGKYGYRLELPTGPVSGIHISLAEINVTTPGLTLTQKIKTKKNKHKKSNKQAKTTSLFWLTEPTCPASGKLSFQEFYSYQPPQPILTRETELSCPQFSR